MHDQNATTVVCQVSSKALAFGPLAVHRSVGNDGYPWTVTHIQTGRVVLTTSTQEDAVKATEALGRCDWDFDDRALIPLATVRAVAGVVAATNERRKVAVT